MDRTAIWTITLWVLPSLAIALAVVVELRAHRRRRRGGASGRARRGHAAPTSQVDDQGLGPAGYWHGD